MFIGAFGYNGAIPTVGRCSALCLAAADGKDAAITVPTNGNAAHVFAEDTGKNLEWVRMRNGDF